MTLIQDCAATTIWEAAIIQATAINPSFTVSLLVLWLICKLSL